MMSQSSENKPVVLTCAQPTGQLHLGNYLGAVCNWRSFLGDYECFFGIVDMHAITVPHEPAELRKNTLDLVAQYLACGLDPEQCHLFIQSHVQGHTELAWILGSMTPLGQLQRMTQFKDKAAKQDGDHIGSGLLTYPVLMAADILLYNADVVPVGEDQTRHLELTRDLAERFNNRYSPTFSIPEARVNMTGARIMSLADPTRKMSKSDPNQAGTLYILDEPDVIRKKVKSATTDSDRNIVAGPEKPGVTNLLNILSAASGKAILELQNEFADADGYAPFKDTVADAVIEMLKPVKESYRTVSGDKSALQQVLKSGADAAQKRAYKMLAKVYRKIGFAERPRY